ncbi:hypothetical protein MD588_19000 [Photobacterium sp. SDRW27]|uniref:hypothetical protein n=1 Tax=Photobacterium obscurum TaxID=2829490 RepID=UPI002243DF40|nr:hypothetical protein [Photobacterium obscurum]MCW8330885.1 hypothetical protein [Photobacterium obscurum]
MADVMPVRTSTNKVEGINRCECGSVRTIHRARGKRAKFLYSICDDCGTNQQTGKFWQDKFNQYYSSVEALQEAERQPQEPEQSEPEAVADKVEPEPMPTETETLSEPEPETKPKAWRVILTGIVLGGLTGGVITRLS